MARYHSIDYVYVSNIRDVNYDTNNSFGGVRDKQTIFYKGHVYGNASDVAVKVLAHNPKNMDLFRELRKLRNLRHRNLVEIYDFPYDDKIALIVSKFYDGLSIYSHLINHPETINGPRVVKRLMTQISSGMQYLHSQDPPIIHGDLNSENCMLTNIESGISRSTVKIANFGLSGIQSVSIKDKVKIPWIDPEISYTKTPTKTSDVYAFAMTSYEIITLGKVPFELNGLSDFKIFNAWYCNEHPIRPPPASPPILRDEVWDLIEKCWDHDPLLRPSYAEISNTLESISGSDLGGTSTVLWVSDGEEEIQMSNSRFEYVFVGFHETGLVYVKQDLSDSTEFIGDDDNATEMDEDSTPFLPIFLAKAASTPVSKKRPESPCFLILITCAIVLLVIGTIVALVLRRPKLPTTTSEEEPKTTSYVRKYTGGHQDWVFAVAASQSNPKRLFSGSDGLLEWNTTTGSIIRNYTEHTDEVRAIAFAENSNSTFLFSGSLDKRILQWNLESGKRVRSFIGHTQGILTIAFLPGNPPRLFSGGWDRTIREWNVSTGEEVQIYKGHTGYVFAVVALAGNPPRLFSGSQDKTIREWNISNGETIKMFTGTAGEIYSLAVLASNPPRLFSASDEEVILEWDANTGEIVRNYTAEKSGGYPSLTVLDANPPLLFAGYIDKSVRKWDLTTGNMITKYVGHNSTVTSLAVAPPYIFSGSADKDIIQWSL